MVKESNPTIESEGKKVKRNKNGVFVCPFKCGDKRYPRQKWKTEQGFRRHLESCYMKPSKVKLRKEKEEERNIAEEIEYKKAMIIRKATSKYKEGDNVFYVGYFVTKPEYEWRGQRRVRARYEEKREYYARAGKIEKVTRRGYVVQGEVIDDSCIFKDLEEAKKLSYEEQKAYQEHLDFSSYCR